MNEVISPEGLRNDGRRAENSRSLLISKSLFTAADGSAFVKLGNTNVVAMVYTQSPAKTHTATDSYLEVDLRIASFCVNNHSHGTRKDKRVVELESVIWTAIDAGTFHLLNT